MDAMSCEKQDTLSSSMEYPSAKRSSSKSKYARFSLQELLQKREQLQQQILSIQDLLEEADRTCNLHRTPHVPNEHSSTNNDTSSAVKVPSTIVQAKPANPDDCVDDSIPNVAENFHVPPNCVPINANVTTFDFERLARMCQFDVIMMDPPWQLATERSTRGVHIFYDSLTDADITSMPIAKLSKPGSLIFIWVINNKYYHGIEMMHNWGYDFVDELVWAKCTVNRRVAKGHGYYLQHAKETCLVGRKRALQQKTVLSSSSADSSKSKASVDSTTKDGSYPDMDHSFSSSNADSMQQQSIPIPDVIYAERRGQSQKPEEIYEFIEQHCPNGNYLEIFGRRNNLRDGWVTIGNEL